MKQHDQVFLGFTFTHELFVAEQYKDLVDDLLDPGATLPPGAGSAKQASPEELQSEFEAISLEVRGLVEAVNSSVATAQGSNDIDTRKRELAMARAKITKLQNLTDRHPSVQLERLEEVMALIEQIDQETDDL